MKSAHDFDVQWLEGVTSGLNKVDARVNSVVHDIGSIDLVLGVQIGIEALLDVLHNWLP